MEFWGPFSFGLVVGWVCYRTLRRKADGVGLGDIASVIGAVGGSAVVAVFKNAAFDAYCIGLAVGFFVYLIVGALYVKQTGEKGDVGDWMGVKDK